MSAELFLTDERFKALAKSGALPAGATVRKTFTAGVKPESKRLLTFTISTSDVDRQGDSISAAGWDLTAYRTNPIVLWAHESRNLPVGRAVNVGIENGRLKATAEFMPSDLYPFADRVYRMLRDGWLTAASVGFRPIEWEWSQNRTHGIDFKRAELIEFSIVPIPANAAALLEPIPAGVRGIKENLLAHLIQLEALR
jgi:HK97 family phage prohead protease